MQTAWNEVQLILKMLLSLSDRLCYTLYVPLDSNMLLFIWRDKCLQIVSSMEDIIFAVESVY